MSDLKIDNKHLSRLADSIEDLHREIQKDIDFLRDESGDLFMRYMAYNRSMNYVKGVDLIMSLYHKNLVSGHALQDPIYKTELYNKKGWDTPRVAEHPFFLDGDDDEDDSEMPDILKKILAGAVLSAIVGRSKDDRNNKDN